MEKTVIFSADAEIMSFNVSNFVYTSGDILKSDVGAIAIPVNVVGIAGAGLAKQWADKFPNVHGKYVEECKARRFQPGKVMILNDDDTGKKFILFPTKIAPWMQSKLKLIERGLRALRWVLEKYPIESVAIPKLGCGLGGLKWKDVHKLITTILEGMETTFYLYGQPA